MSIAFLKISLLYCERDCEIIFYIMFIRSIEKLDFIVLIVEPNQ